MSDVFIGHGTRMESAVGINMSPHLQTHITKDRVSDVAYLAVYDCEIDRPLNPTEIFLVTEGATNKLLSALHDVHNPDQKPLWERNKIYSCEDLKKYIERDIGQNKQVITDHIVVTNDKLVDRVVEEVKKLGHNPITFV